MTRTIWLASYPRSGNTWMRILLANALSSANKPIDINKIFVGGAASDRSSFEYASLIDSSLLTDDEIDSLRPRVHAAIAQRGFEQDSTGPDALPIQFVKVHDAYTFNCTGEPLLGGAQGASGAILILRDPRDVVSSLAHHFNCSIDRAIAFMNDRDAVLCKTDIQQPEQLRQKLASWSEHVASWMDQTDIRVHSIRYEDLTVEPESVLRAALAFAGVSVTDAELNRSVAYSDFAQLRGQEDKNRFTEAPMWNGGKVFFRSGQAGSWRDELSLDQVARIESHHGPMMRRLGYKLSCRSAHSDPALAVPRAGKL